MIHNAARALAAIAMATMIGTPALADKPSPHQKAPDPNEVICEKQEVIGSRLQTKRICRTRAEWADLRLQDQQAIDRVQIQRGSNGE